MRKITLVLDGGPDTERLLDLLIYWKNLDELEVSMLSCDTMPLQTATGAQRGKGLSLDSLFDNAFGNTQSLPYLNGQVSSMMHKHILPQHTSLLTKLETLQIQSLRNCGSVPLSVISQESKYTDVLVLGKRLFYALHQQAQGDLQHHIHCPLYIPGEKESQPDRAVLLSELQPVKQTLQLLCPLLAGRELLLLNLNNASNVEEKQLVRYVQTYFPAPAYYYTNKLEERDLRVIMTANSLVSIPLSAWQRQDSQLNGLLVSEKWGANASIFFTV